jgi:GNAT superfamily N-acetyltransferase
MNEGRSDSIADYLEGAASNVRAAVTNPDCNAAIPPLSLFMTDVKIQTADSVDALVRCFDVMQELRPHLTMEKFIAQVERQQEQGYRIAFLESEGEVRAAAGFRLMETLAWGRIIYVDDLSTMPYARSQGHGGALIDWLTAEAKRLDCGQLHLDSGVHRFDAHRFYLRKRLDITCHHFAIIL